MTPEEEIQRAEKARQILEEPLVKEAFSILEDAFLNGIQTSAVKDCELREKICQMLISLRALKQHLVSTMETGKFAQEQLRQQTLWEMSKQKVVGMFN